MNELLVYDITMNMDQMLRRQSCRLSEEFHIYAVQGRSIKALVTKFKAGVSKPPPGCGPQSLFVRPAIKFLIR